MTMRSRTAVVLGVVTPLGFATKFYQGAGEHFINNYLGGVLYEIFWVFAVLLAWPFLSPAKVASGVFLATCVLEALQLWRPAILQVIRETFIGQALIGTTFSWGDFPCYAAGCLLAVALARRMAGGGGRGIE